MKIWMIVFLLSCLSLKGYTQTKTIHVFVALCDNQNQGIVPVPQKLGNGQDPQNNLYWGAMYGMKSFFAYKTKEWKLIDKPQPQSHLILDRVLFKHVSEDVYLLAEAYDGAHIQTCIAEFLKASNGQHSQTLSIGNKNLSFGGGSDLLAYMGHDGLMEFSVDVAYQKEVSRKKEVIILACYSQEFFSPEIAAAQAHPLLWTTHLMAPEAYTLRSAIEGWLHNETGAQIEERAAQTYHAYQKCGIRGARNLFTTGFN